MKKFILIAAILFALPLTAFASSFPDVSSDHANYKAIEYLKSEGIIHGYENGDFGPDDTLNRAQAMKIISEAFDVDHSGTYEILFPDVKTADWFFPYVMGAHKAGIVHGYPDGTFGPDKEVNLAESLKLMVLAAGVTLPATVTNDVYEDVKKDAWYAPHTYYAREYNLISSDGKGMLYPEKALTRAAFAEIIYRMMKVLENGGKAYAVQETWPLYESTVLPFKMNYDPGWQLIENSKDVTFFKKDNQYSQFSPERIYPNSAKIVVTLDGNSENLSSTDYFLNIKDVFTGAKYTQFTLNGLPAMEVIYSEERTVDWYIYLADENVLTVYTEYGDGGYSYQAPKAIKAMLSSLKYQEVETNYEAILSEIFENVLVQDKGMEMLDKLSDKIIIETDSIGVGTGPIDYYYSEAVNYTFKYERANDTILATQEGKTSAF